MTSLRAVIPMRRDNLAWALTAVLPHCGSSRELATVGIESGLRGTLLYATDRYTVGVARIGPALGISATLPKSEAADLLRFVRPSRVAEQEEHIETLLDDRGGLHIALQSDSAVFETEPSRFNFGDITLRLRLLEALPNEFERLEYNPAFAVRFAKAKRETNDRLCITPKRFKGRNGVALVTVGKDFLGAIAGLSYERSEPSTVAGFLELEGEAA